MITFIVIAIIAIILIKFFVYAAKPENQIESKSVREKFKPFITVITDGYEKNGINYKVSDIDEDERAILIEAVYLTPTSDRINHFLLVKNNVFYIEMTYFIGSLSFKQVYNLEVAKMDGYFQKVNSQKIIDDFHRRKVEFQSENELQIIQEMTSKFLYD